MSFDDDDPSSEEEELLSSDSSESLGSCALGRDDVNRFFLAPLDKVPKMIY